MRCSWNCIGLHWHFHSWLLATTGTVCLIFQWKKSISQYWSHISHLQTRWTFYRFQIIYHILKGNSSLLLSDCTVMCQHFRNAQSENEIKDKEMQISDRIFIIWTYLSTAEIKSCPNCSSCMEACLLILWYCLDNYPPGQ